MALSLSQGQSVGVLPRRRGFASDRQRKAVMAKLTGKRAKKAYRIVPMSSGRCPKCGGSAYPTGRSIRVPSEMELAVSTESLGGRKKWIYENEYRCSKCGKRFGQSQLLPAKQDRPIYVG